MSRPLPITPERIARDLGALGVGAGDAVLMHTSLSAISGPESMVVGGAVGVIEAILDRIGPEGTLVMPAFSADYSDPESWTNLPAPAEWWPVLREAMPAWQADRAPTFRIGVVAEVFRSMHGVLRSEHPHSSFCGIGARAADILSPHPLDDPLSERGPLGALRACGAKVVLIGCGFRACTAFHLAEHETRRPPPRVTSAAPVLRDGERVWVRWSELAYDASRFAAIGEELLEARICRSGRVGQAPTHVFDLGDGVRFARDWLDHRAG